MSDSSESIAGIIFLMIAMNQSVAGFTVSRNQLFIPHLSSALHLGILGIGVIGTLKYGKALY